MSTESNQNSQSVIADTVADWIARGHRIQTEVEQASRKRIEKDGRARKHAGQELPGLRHCCACRIALIKPSTFRELWWLPRRGKYRPALCYRDLNKLVMEELAPPVRPKHARGLGSSGHSGESSHGIRRPGAKAMG